MTRRMRLPGCHGHVALAARGAGLAAACVLLLSGTAAPVATAAARGPLAAPAAAHHGSAPAGRSLGRQVLGPRDGWAAEGTGTTGGTAAGARHTVTVTDRAGLAAALAEDPGVPRIIQVKGTIDVNTDDAGRPLSCADYAADGYDLDAYLAAYDPAVWGRDRVPSGELEDLRAASAGNQAARVELRVPSDTTVVGLGKGARILGGDLQIKGADDVIVRNLTFEDAFDCFPQWDPTDGDTGNWNSEYDNLVVDGSTHVWIDHDTFTDGRRPDDRQPSYYGRIFQQHDGELDVVKGADYVTASWNVFTDHDKTLLFGTSDSAAGTDDGHLRVTLHHNLFKDIGERAPRVRFGRVDAYNNHYVVGDASAYVYSLGVGVSSHLVAEANAFELPDGVGAGQIITRWNGTALTAGHNLVNGRPTDLLGAYNAAHPDAVLDSGAGWTPTLRPRVDDPRAVPVLVGRGAGAGRGR